MPIIVCFIQMGVLNQQIYILDNGQTILIGECLFEELSNTILMLCKKYNTNKVILRGSPQLLLPYIHDLTENKIEVELIK